MLRNNKRNKNMTKQEINKAFRGALLIFNRAGADEIITIESPKEKKSIKISTYQELKEFFFYHIIFLVLLNRSLE